MSMENHNLYFNVYVEPHILNKELTFHIEETSWV